MAKIRGQPVLGHPLCQALLPVLAVTMASNHLLLLPIQVGGLGPGCPETSCPSISVLIILKIIWLKSAWKACKNSIKYSFSMQNQLICH